jgi:hypothetical protein
VPFGLPLKLPVMRAADLRTIEEMIRLLKKKVVGITDEEVEGIFKNMFLLKFSLC